MVLRPCEPPEPRHPAFPYPQFLGSPPPEVVNWPLLPGLQPCRRDQLGLLSWPGGSGAGLSRGTANLLPNFSHIPGSRPAFLPSFLALASSTTPTSHSLPPHPVPICCPTPSPTPCSWPSGTAFLELIATNCTLMLAQWLIVNRNAWGQLVSPTVTALHP